MHMNTEVWLLNSLFRLAGTVNSELTLVRSNMERMILKLPAIFTVQFNTQTDTKSKHFLKYLAICFFTEYVHFSSSTTLSTQATPCQNLKIFRNYFTFNQSHVILHVAPAVTFDIIVDQICRETLPWPATADPMKK